MTPGIAGIGVDVVDIARFERVLERTPAFAARVFSDEERALPPRSLAARWGAREALRKAVGAAVGRARGIPTGLTLRDLAVTRTNAGAPTFARGEQVDAALAGLGIGALHLSLSHDGGVAVAMVVAERLKGDA